jgi:SRSO17 transposase
MALVLLEQLCRDGVQKAPVLADSLYGDCSALRQGVRQLGLEFFVQVTPTGHTAWQQSPRLIKKQKRCHPAPDQPKAQTLLQIASSWPQDFWQPVQWKATDGTTRHSRLAWKEIYLTHSLREAAGQPEKVWLVVDWPQGDAQPYHCYLADFKSAPQKLPCLRLSRARWHVEQYFQRSKQDLGLDHYEGRSWRGFHHHLILSALAYLFVTLKYLRSKKNFWRLLGGSAAADPAIVAEINRPLPLLP